MRSMFARLPPLHSKYVDLYRNGKLSKMGLFSTFLYTFFVNCVTTGARKKPIEDMFCFIYSQQCIIIISSRKICGFLSSVFKKTIPNNTTSIFQEVGGVTQPRIFCRWHKNFSWYRVNHHKSD